jgi:hypothetical protein
MNPRLKFLALLGLVASALVAVKVSLVYGMVCAFGTAQLCAPHNRRFSLGVDPAGTHNDGGVVFGSQIVTIDGVTYIAEDIDVKFPSKIIERTNEVGVDNGDVTIEKAFTGTMTLQLAAAATPIPPIGKAVTIVSLNAVSLSAKIIDTGVKFVADGETKVSVSFKKKFA